MEREVLVRAPLFLIYIHPSKTPSASNVNKDKQSKVTHIITPTPRLYHFAIQHLLFLAIFQYF